MAECALRKKWAIEVQIEIVRTRGDEGPSRTGVFNLSSRKAGRKGIFTAELERALVEKEIDVAVHSAKDIPSEMDGALMIAAVLPRAPNHCNAGGEGKVGRDARPGGTVLWEKCGNRPAGSRPIRLDDEEREG